MSKRLLPVVLVGMGLASPATALTIGDPAPALKVSDWIQGDPIDLQKSKGKQIVVVEFWATWCGPCRTSIPHLSELQKKFKDKGVVIVGISDEGKDTLAPFVKKMGDKMNYVVASDADDATDKAYMEAFNMSGIPHAFVIDRSGVIAWHGHPMSGLEKVIEDMLAGKFDIAEAKKVEKARGLAREYFSLVIPSGEGDSSESGAATRPSQDDLNKARKLGEEIIVLGAKDAMLLNEFAWRVLDDEAIRHRDLNLGLTAARKAYDACEGKDPNVVDTYARALFDTGSKKQAIEYQRKAIELCEDKSMKEWFKKKLVRYEE